MVMIGNLSSQSEWKLSIEGMSIEAVSTYCYLRIIISNNGKFTQTTNTLFMKELEAYFNLETQFTDVHRCYMP